MDPTADQLVIFAVRGGDLALVQERIAAGGRINAVDATHGSALSEAVRRADLQILDWLIENGADVNAKYGDGIGPLEIALRDPNPDVVRRLLYAGAVLARTARPYYRERLEACLRDSTGEGT